MQANDLYLVVLPLIRVPSPQLGISGLTSGSVQEFLTLLPDRNFATEFFPDELLLYVETFKASVKYITGGHVTRYEVIPQEVGDGRWVVKVVQYVA